MTIKNLEEDICCSLPKPNSYLHLKLSLIIGELPTEVSLKLILHYSKTPRNGSFSMFAVVS